MKNEAFSDSYHTKAHAHDQIWGLKNSRLEPERRFVDLSEEEDPPLRDPSYGSTERPHRRRQLPIQSLDANVVGGGLRREPLACEYLEHDSKLTVQLCGGWHHMPLGVLILSVGLLVNNQFAHQWHDKNTMKLTRH